MNGTGQQPPVSEPADLNRLDDDAYRMRVREFLHEHYPEDKRHIIGRARWGRHPGLVHDAVARRACWRPARPREHGGMGLSASKQLIWIEEQERHGAARVPDHGINMIGPTLIRSSNARAARALPAAHSQRRTSVGAGLFRTRRRFGSGHACARVARWKATGW